MDIIKGMAAFLLMDYISFSYHAPKTSLSFSTTRFARVSLPFLITPMVYVYQKDKN